MNTATYPIKTAQKAFRELQTRQGFIVNVGNNQQIITVRKASLAYFDSLEPQQYLQPIYVFSGDNGFQAYVRAIEAEWLE